MLNKLLPFLILLLPQKHFEIYYGLILFYCLITFKKNDTYNFNYLLVFMFFAIIVFFRTTFVMGLDDFKELFKLFFFLFMLNKIDYNFKIDFKIFKNALIVYVFISFIVVINQVLKLSDVFNSFISQIFLGDSQQILLTYDNVRAPGLSPGVGQQGVVFLLLSMFLWIHSKHNKKLINYILLLICIVILTLSQSKSSFFVFLFFAMIQLLKSKSKLKFLGLPILFIGLFKLAQKIIIFFKEYEDLLSNFWSSSLDGRIQNWLNFINPMLENPFYILFGLGRNYLTNFNIKSSVFDSDYIYVFANFGLIGLLFFGFFINRFLKKFKEKKLIIITGLIVGFTLNFFLEPKSFLLIILISKYIHIKNYENKNLLDFN